MRPDLDLSSSPTDILRSELVRQRSILLGEVPVRLLATTLCYGISAVFLPAGLIVTVALINLLAELLADGLLRDVEALIARTARRWMLSVWTFVQEACFVLPPALMWHLEDPYLKAFAVGITASTMMHVSTVRAIYLPMGLSGALAIWIVVLGSNTLYWGGRGEWVSLGATTLCAMIGLGYFVSALISNHRLHRESSAGWAEAVAANAAKTRFLAQMSHELRTPLNAILGMGHAELARQTDMTGRERLTVLVESAAGLGVLLDDILDLAAVQEGRLPIRPEPIDPRGILTATVALFRPQAEAAGLALDIALHDDVPSAAHADGRRLRQCLSNILSNAVKYTDQGGIRVTARMAAPDLLEVDVEDTGQGVPADLGEAIFEPFRRGPGGQAGTGLGLTISRTLARRMGGDLVLLPSDRGARFRLTLQMRPGDPLAQVVTPLPPLNLRGQRILVVDDIATNRLVAATYLRMFGASVTEADSGEAALQMVAVVAPSAILLDMNMPGLDGVETLQRLRRAEGAVARIPVVAMTADATDIHKRDYLAAGLDGYVAKPLSPDRLAEALRPLLPRTPDAA